jgi:alkanesulfonate monooxygenase
MSVEFIGYSGTQEQSEVVAPTGPLVNPGFLKEFARSHERAGFDRVLVAHHSTGVDAFKVANQTLAATERLGVLLAHRPGFVAPTQVARKYATLEAFHPNRVAMHVITGGDGPDLARDGDWLDKPSRYRRTGEFLQIVKQQWGGAEHLDFEGTYYHVKDAWSSVRPTAGRIPIYFAGASQEAIETAAQYADTYAVWGEPLAGIRERVTQIGAEAAKYERKLGLSVSVRPIVADTEEQAWERGREFLRITEKRADEFAGRIYGPGAKQQHGAGNVGSKRLLDFAAEKEVHDSRLWTALSKATGALGNSTALVGDYEQVADALVEYVDAGASTLLIRGYEPLADVERYGRVIKLVKQKLAARVGDSELLAA